MKTFRTKLGILKVALFFVLFIPVSHINSVAQTDNFIPVNGMTIGPNYIVFEAEATTSPLGKWQIVTPEDSRYKNSSVPPINNTHLEFTGNDHNSGPPTSPLEYKFVCPKTAAYRLGGRLYQRLEGLQDDKCNDVYIKMAGDFTSGNSIALADLKKNYKFFGRGVDKWGALYSIEIGHGASKHQGPVVYQLKEGETYTFTVSGRAQRTNVDYWILYENSINYTIGAHKDIAALNNEKYRPDILDCETFAPIDMDFTAVDGFAEAQKVKISGVDVLQSPNPSEWAATQLIYRGTRGDAYFTLNTMLEKGGESMYRLKINGELIAEVTNDRIQGTEVEDYTIQSHVIYPKTLLEKGDTIQIEFNNTSNGLVTDGSDTARAYGIFANLKICTTGEIKKLWRLEHPAIWTTPDEKAEVLDKIENYDWAKSVLNKAKSLIDSRVNTHVSNPNAILNTIPALASDDNLSESQASSANAGHAKVLGYAAYAGMVYHLTEEEKYAQFAADILWYYIERLAPRSPSNTAMSGSHFYDPRSGYPKFAIAYDFMVNYLKQPDTKVYQKSTGNKVAFDNVKAQKAVHNIAMNTLNEQGGVETNYGKRVSNHPILRAPGVLFSILCVEDDIERERLFNVFWKVGTKRQNSFTKTILPMFGEQGIWPESVSYSFMPNVALVLNLVDRIKPELNVMDDNMHILDGNFLFDNLRHPNRRFVTYGDSHRDNDGTGNLYRYTLNLAVRNGFDEYEQKAKVALRQSYDVAGGYNPKVSVSTFDNFNGFSDLFWGVPIPGTVEGEIDFQKPTVIIKHAGVALQRNYVEENNREYGLCGIIGGAHYVHSHVTGITMELYGSGYIMAANAGLPKSLAERKLPVHQNYFWRHAGNNTMIVNGTTHGIQNGAWNSNSYLWQNTTVNVASEPKHLEDPVSPNFSFATQFLDDKVNNDQQQRTLSTIRTSETTAYYFDMFRSKSLGTNNFHDYIYHNIGDQTNITNEYDELMSVSPTNRYQNDIGDPVQSPGWRFFENTEVTEPYDKSVKIRFDVNYNNRYMHMLMPGGVEREYTKALGPATREAKNGYVNKKTQVVAIRQQGEAWNKPYVAIFEPSTSSTSSVTEVEHLYNEDAIIGAKVSSKIGDKTVEDYILCLPANGSVTLPEHGILFTGRFAVVRYEQSLEDAFTTLYIGEGDSLTFGDIDLIADANKKGILVEEGEPYFGRLLLFKNIKDRDVIAKGSDLSIEAFVGEEYTKVTLWVNDTINLGPKTEAPYIWADHASLTNMQDDVYKFTLVASDSAGYNESKTIFIETPSQKPYTGDKMPHTIPGKIEFEDYDTGGEGFGYHDISVRDSIQFSYRDGDDVELGRNGTVVSSLESGEWLEFTVYVQHSGIYNLSIRHRTTVAPSIQGFSVILPNTGDTLLSNVETFYTGRSDFYLDEIGDIYLNQGEQVIRFAILKTGFDLDYMELKFVKATSAGVLNQDSRQIDVYPNPATETVNVRLNGFIEATVGIYNMQGQLIQQKLAHKHNSIIQLSRGDELKSGVYLIRVLDENNQAYYKKLIFR